MVIFGGHHWIQTIIFTHPHACWLSCPLVLSPCTGSLMPLLWVARTWKIPAAPHIVGSWQILFFFWGGDIPQREESGTFSGWVSRVAVLGRNHLYYLGSMPWVSVKKHYSVNNAMRFRRISLISEETCTLQKWCFPDLECTGLKMFAIHSLI